MIVKYQGIRTRTIRNKDEVIEITPEEVERDPREIILVNSSKILILETNKTAPEPTTTSQVVIPHEEEVTSQNFGELSDEELEEWIEVLNTNANDEQWGRDGVHEKTWRLLRETVSIQLQPTMTALVTSMGMKKGMTPRYPQPCTIDRVNRLHLSKR